MPAKGSAPSEDAYQQAAKELGCEIAAIKAVAKVEAGSQGAFLGTGEPVILFEAHVFDRLTEGQFRGAKAASLPQDQPAAVLSREKWTPGTYGTFGVQHARLAAAVMLHREAALKACSWGLFQLMGENYKRCGFETLQAFVNAMMWGGVDAHLAAFVEFIRSDKKLLAALQARDWATFARIYNGPSYARNKYDKKLAAAYAGEI